MALKDPVVVPNGLIRAGIRWDSVSTGFDRGLAVAFSADERLLMGPAVCAGARCHIASVAAFKAVTASSGIRREAIAFPPARVYASTVVSSSLDEDGGQGEHHG